ncbi:hypothetical protein T10_4095 [Trichinella papuae]|uniref:Uncharacterized protein n=1 Tax=Trichinella papuae TaxID=268474 RepID=A0A0V1N1B1_9BILA|nr:hypothetical protein T10_4095 [Trichinella papuae]
MVEVRRRRRRGKKNINANTNTKGYHLPPGDRTGSSDVQLELNCSWSSGIVYYHHVMDIAVLKRKIDTDKEEIEEKAQCQFCFALRSLSEARLDSLSTGGRRQTKLNHQIVPSQHSITVDNELEIGRGQRFYSGLFDLKALGGLDESVLFLPLHQPPDSLQLIGKYLINGMDLCGISDSKCKQRLQKRQSRLDNISQIDFAIIIRLFSLREMACWLIYFISLWFCLLSDGNANSGKNTLQCFVLAERLTFLVEKTKANVWQIKTLFGVHRHKPTNLIKVDKMKHKYVNYPTAPMQTQRGTG